MHHNQNTHPALRPGFPSDPEPAVPSLCAGRPRLCYTNQKHRLQIQTRAGW